MAFETYRMIETTDEPYGVVQLVWHYDMVSGLPQRRLLIRPDGTRLCFRELKP